MLGTSFEIRSPQTLEIYNNTITAILCEKLMEIFRKNLNVKNSIAIGTDFFVQTMLKEKLH